jgi:hypothetical protein
MQQAKIEIQQLAEQYIQIWNEPDAALRRARIAKIWTEDGVQFTPQHEYRGYERLEKRVESAHEEFVKQGGCVFRLSGEYEAHHGAVKLTWEMIPSGGGKVAATGLVFLLLSDDGRACLDYHF